MVSVLREKRRPRIATCDRHVAQNLIENHDISSEEAIRDGISGNICRCTGYQNIVKAIADFAHEASGKESA